MTVGKFFGYLFLILLILLVLAPPAVVGWAFLGGYITDYMFTYRLTVDVEVDGATRSSSSLFRVHAFKSSKQPSKDSVLASWSVYGVAPLIDLGPYGTLVAARDYNSAHYWKYREERGLPKFDDYQDVRRPVNPGELPYLVYFPGKLHLDWPEPHRTLAGITQRVQSKRFPPFIWIPPSGNFREARQLMPDQFAEVIGPGVKLKAVWIEPVRWVFWVPTTYDPMPKWLEDNIADVDKRISIPMDRRPPGPPQHEFRLHPTMILGHHAP